MIKWCHERPQARGAQGHGPRRAPFPPHGSPARLTVTNRPAAGLQGRFPKASEAARDKKPITPPFRLGRDGNVVGAATPVAGIPAGTIVGITAHDDLVVAPIAHLASDFGKAAVPVASGLEQVQLVPTKEVAACWAANDDGQVCVTNPGSMTVSCGRLGPAGFLSYTGAAASPSGDSVFDLDVRGRMVGIQATMAGAPMLLTFRFTDREGDFLAPASEIPTGTARATGALLLPSMSR